MDAEWLASQLSSGRSIEAIAREVGRSPSTVAYWVSKHGLTSAHAPRHAARGGIARETLEPLVAAGMPIRAIAEQLGVSYTTVRHWLQRHELTTPRARRLADTADARAAGADTCQGQCPRHGSVTLVRRGLGAFRCPRCRSEAVDRRRREMKRILVAEAGGACILCGYSGTPAALHFHHVDPTTKSFGVGYTGVTRSLAAARAEAAKCVLLCARCHAEVEAGVKRLTFRPMTEGDVAA
jgi:transposase-like protein